MYPLHRSIVSAVFLLLINLTLVMPNTVSVARATGLGLYFSLGFGETEFDEEWSGNLWDDLNTKGDSHTFGGGLVFDTARLQALCAIATITRFGTIIPATALWISPRKDHARVTPSELMNSWDVVLADWYLRS